MKVGVLDASAAAAMVLYSQKTVTAETLLAQAADWSFSAPHFFEFELFNTLLNRSRRRGATAEEYEGAVRLFGKLQVDIYRAVTKPEFEAVLRLASSEHLSLFDANYLQLALQRTAVLISKDIELLAAAQRRNVEILDVR